MKKTITYIGLMVIGAIVSTTTVFALIQVKQFPDVDYNSYYGSAVNNMVGMGIMTGYDNGNFGPNDAVTRAQLATTLDRYNVEVAEMKVLICDGINRDQVVNTQIYDKLCPPLAQ